MSAILHFLAKDWWEFLLLALAVIALVFFQGRRVFRLAASCGRVLESFDTKVIDGIGVDGTGVVVRGLSKIAARVETWGIGGPFRLLAGIVEAISFPMRRIQTGFVQDYLLCAAIGLVAILGYFLHLAQRAIH
ncbi:MAG TPA: hypothetical protein VGD60_07470 [Candidatus Acidoferrales bacterium]